MTAEDFNLFCMGVAKLISYYSYAKRRKVGAVVAKDGNILAFGYNGTPHGFENICESYDCTRIIDTDCPRIKGINRKCEDCKYGVSKTNDDVVHAEENCIAKLAKSTISSEGATMYITCSPCARCARLILQSGIKKIYYAEAYHSTEGIEMLKKGGVDTYFLKIN